MPIIRQRLSAWATFGARCCFGAAVLLIPFRYRIILLPRPAVPVYRDYTDFLLYSADVAVLLMLALWSSSLALRPRRVTLGPRHIWIPLAGLTLAGWISSISSYDPHLSLYHALRLLVLFWFYVFVVNEMRSPAWILIPVGLQLTTQSIIAVAQFLAQRSVQLQNLGELSLEPASPGVSVVISGSIRLLRAYGLTDHPNILGGCLAFGLVLLSAIALRAKKWPAAWSIFIPATAALLVSFSRAAWVAFAVGISIVTVAEVVHRRWEAVRGSVWLGLSCAIVLASFILAYPRFFGVRINAGDSFSSPSAEQQSIGQRVILVKTAMPLLLDHPLLGVGLGASPLAMRTYYPDFALNYEPPHWTLFDAALETGALGAISYLALLVYPVLVFIRQRRVLWPDIVATTALAVLISIMLVGFFDYYTWLLSAGRMWQWLAWGIWGVALERTRS